MFFNSKKKLYRINYVHGGVSYSKIFIGRDEVHAFRKFSWSVHYTRIESIEEFTLLKGGDLNETV